MRAVYLLSLFGLMGVLLPSHGSAAEAQFTVEEAKSAEIRPSDDAAWKSASKGESFKIGAWGKTGSGGTMVVTFDAQSKFRLLPKAEVMISPDTRDSKVRKVTELTMTVNKGGVVVTESPKNYELRVQTPTAVCGAVGTVYTVEVESATKSSFSCKEGEIQARSLEDAETTSFEATGIRKGGSLTASALPGKENSFTELTTEGKMDLALAGGASQKVGAGTVQLAQAKTDGKTMVAMKSARGHYVLEGDREENFSEGEGKSKVDDYIKAARKEARIKNGLEHGDLDAAARDATEKRQALMDFRSIVRDQVREGGRTSMDLPTRAPGM